MYISLSTTGMDTIVHVWAEFFMFSSSSRFNTVAVSTICTALWASQQHANLPAVVWRTATYPTKLMHGGKRYSFACVHDTIGVYMYT